MDFKKYKYNNRLNVPSKLRKYIDRTDRFSPNNS